MSFGQLLRDQDLSADAKAVLQPVYDHFTEGFDTAALKAAKALFDTLQFPGLRPAQLLLLACKQPTRNRRKLSHVC